MLAWLFPTVMSHDPCADAKLQSAWDSGVGLAGGTEDPRFCKAVLFLSFVFKRSEVPSLRPFS